MRAEATAASVRLRRKKASAVRLAQRWTAIGGVLVLLALAVISFVYAGSPERLAAGVKIAGVPVGGLSATEARQLLEGKARALRHVPVVFTAGGQQFPITPNRLGIRIDWNAAANSALARGNGFLPIRGLRRLKASLFGVEITAPVHVWTPALDYQVGLLAKAIDQPHRDAAIRRQGLRIRIVPGQTGRLLDGAAAGPVIVNSLGSLSRRPVALPVKVDEPKVTAGELVPAARLARRTLRSSVQLTLGPTRWRLRRAEIAKILLLPAAGRSKLEIGGVGAARFFHDFAKQVNRPPRDATWRSTHGGIRVAPAKDGFALERDPTQKALFAALLSPTNRVAQISVATTHPQRSTAQAKSMGITGLVGGYTTYFSGVANRIHNVDLVAHLIDGTLIGPGATFSFNGTTGDRNASKGFLEAPVIINGEVQNALGGGVCQVSTTVFNAAYEGGLDITARTNHALYISHYPQGRDATVNYPDTDLKFVNDTPRWLLLRTFVSSDALTVNLYGAPQHRRIVSTTAALVKTGPVPVKKVPDRDLLKGQTIVDQYGSPPLSTSVHRLVYSASGKLLHDDTWYSSYRGETQVVKVGTKVPPPPKKKPKPKNTTTTTPTTTTPKGGGQTP